MLLKCRPHTIFVSELNHFFFFLRLSPFPISFLVPDKRTTAKRVKVSDQKKGKKKKKRKDRTWSDSADLNSGPKESLIDSSFFNYGWISMLLLLMMIKVLGCMARMYALNTTYNVTFYHNKFDLFLGAHISYNWTW